MLTAATKFKRRLLFGRKAMTNLDSVLKSNFANKGPYSESYGFSSSHIWMWELEYEGWVLRSWCFWAVVLEKTLESPLDGKEIKTVYPRGNQSWIFIGGTNAETEAPILWPPDVKRQLVRKVPDAGKDWLQEEKGWQRIRQLDGITDSMDMSLSKLWVMVKDRPGVLQSMVSQRVGHNWVLNNNKNLMQKMSCKFTFIYATIYIWMLCLIKYSINIIRWTVVLKIMF